MELDGLASFNRRARTIRFVPGATLAVLNHSRAAGRATPDLYGLFESLEEATLAPHRPKFYLSRRG